MSSVPPSPTSPFLELSTESRSDSAGLQSSEPPSYERLTPPAKTIGNGAASTVTGAARSQRSPAGPVRSPKKLGLRDNPYGPILRREKTVESPGRFRRVQEKAPHSKAMRDACKVPGSLVKGYMEHRVAKRVEEEIDERLAEAHEVWLDELEGDNGEMGIALLARVEKEAEKIAIKKIGKGLALSEKKYKGMLEARNQAHRAFHVLVTSLDELYCSDRSGEGWDEKRREYCDELDSSVLHKWVFNLLEEKNDLKIEKQSDKDKIMALRSEVADAQLRRCKAELQAEQLEKEVEELQAKIAKIQDKSAAH